MLLNFTALLLIVIVLATLFFILLKHVFGKRCLEESEKFYEKFARENNVVSRRGEEVVVGWQVRKGLE